jgi:hypothetical protein
VDPSSITGTGSAVVPLATRLTIREHRFEFIELHEHRAIRDLGGRKFDRIV